MTTKRAPRGVGLLLDDLVRELICERDTNDMWIRGPKLVRALERAEAALADPKPEVYKTLCCDFCGKTQRETKKLIAGPAVYICDECAGLCFDILVEDIGLPLPNDARGVAVRAIVAAQWATMVRLIEAIGFSETPLSLGERFLLSNIAEGPTAAQIVDGAA